MTKSKSETEFDNLQALIDFQHSWEDESFSLEAAGPGLHFYAQVDYTSPNRSISEQTNVRAFLSGFKETGQLDIEETSRMPVELYHLRISRSFGEYLFDSESRELIISNKSDKMGGKYTIRILPLGEAQNT